MAYLASNAFVNLGFFDLEVKDKIENINSTEPEPQGTVQTTMASLEDIQEQLNLPKEDPQLITALTGILFDKHIEYRSDTPEFELFIKIRNFHLARGESISRSITLADNAVFPEGDM